MPDSGPNFPVRISIRLPKKSIFTGVSVSYPRKNFRDVGNSEIFTITNGARCTIRVGDVYLGVDKVGHMLGFGRRYFRSYLRLVKAGYSEEDAMERIVRWGITRSGFFRRVALWMDDLFYGRAPAPRPAPAWTREISFPSEND